MSTCDRCNILVINGVACHETGCPNTPIGRCSACQTDIFRGDRHGVCYANDWDGIPLCFDCAERQAEYEADQAASEASLEAFLASERAFLLECLQAIVADLKRSMSINPAEYTEHGCEDPSIDIRLCIDPYGDSFSWVFRTGLVDFDPMHSEYCSASCVGLDTNADELLADLISGLET